LNNASYSQTIDYVRGVDRVADVQRVSGAESVVLILVEFADLNHTKSRSDISNLFFSRVNSYFVESSFNITWVTGNSTDWLKLSKNLAYYGADSRDSIDVKGYQLIQDSVNIANPYVNFKLYKHVMIVHAGYGQETSHVSTDIWSSHYYTSPPIYADGVGIDDLSVVPESEISGFDPTGVYAHEFAHGLGMPDLYNENDPNAEYVGRWDLMALGTSNGIPPGSSPAQFTGWGKIKLGWTNRVQSVATNAYANVTLNPLEESEAVLHAVKLPVTSTTYYLIEVRRQIGFDQYLPTSGVLVTYVDEMLSSGHGIVKVKDANPSTSTLNDAAFQVGQTFADYAKNVRISILSSDSLSYLIFVDRRSPMPDLTIADLSLNPQNPHPGDNTTFTITVKNIGAQNALNFYVDATLDGQLLTSPKLSLDADRSTTLTVVWTATGGSHILTVIADATGVISEYSETNNERAISFVVGYTLRIEAQFSNVSISIDDRTVETDLNGVITVSVLSGVHEVGAQSPIQVSEGSRGLFDRWSDGDLSNPRSLNISSDTSLSVEYRIQFYLTVTGNGGVVSGAGWYDQGATANATAVSPCNVVENQRRMVFKSWSGGFNSNSPNVTFTMNSPRSLNATWTLQYYLSIASNFGDPQGEGWYDSDSRARFSVFSPVEHGNRTRRIFLRWSGDYAGNELSGSISMDSPKKLFADWKTEYQLSFTAGGLPENVSISIVVNNAYHNGTTPHGYSNWFESDSSISFAVAPANITVKWSKYNFSHWQNSNGSRVESPMVARSGDTLTAIYNQSPGCLIATATYGSELSPEVQSLRRFRDTRILPTFAGSQFMSVFDSFYYSFSPDVAEYVSRSEAARSLFKVLLYPVIKILSLAELASGAFTFNGELGAFVAGLVASALIGTVYFFPVLSVPLILMNRRRMLSSRKPILSLMFLFLFSISIVIVSEFSKSAFAMMFATSSLVLATIFLSSLLLGVGVVKSFSAFKHFLPVPWSSKRFSRD
jgi:M6 family metalloprotease-like protein/uncharacterized repeat protein (TIGR01451 family)